MASSYVGGLSGAFIPVSEDQGMIRCSQCRYALTLEKLEAMTCVCSVGLDMIAIPGKTSASTISGIIADEMAIGMVNQKTTAVRLIPVIGKVVGETAEFGGLLGYAPIMPVNQFGCEAFVRAEREESRLQFTASKTKTGEIYMKKIAIVTDSNSGITQKEGREMGISVVPMPFFIDGELFLEDITLSQEEFYKKLGEDSDISTSQPSPGEILELWDKLLEEYDEVVHIPMSSGLSSSCETAITLSEDYDGRVQVVDNQRISVTQVQSVLDAIKLRNEGKSAEEIERFWKRKNGSQHLYHSRYAEISEKRRQNYPCGRGSGHRAQFKARPADSG